MKLSIWHCQVLYIVSRLELPIIAAHADVSLSLLTKKAQFDMWVFKRNKFRTLTNESKENLNILECLLGEFQNDSARVEYVQSILEKLKNNDKTQTKESLKDQFVNQLNEFGMDTDNAKRFVNKLEKDLVGSQSEYDAVSDVVESTKLSVQEKIDTINAGYEFLVQSHSEGASELHNQLRKGLDWMSRMMSKIEADLPEDLDFKTFVGIQRDISYLASSYSKFATLYYESSGLKSHVNHHSVAAKLFGNGYQIIPRDSLGRLVDTSN